jgi:NDP-sugar pyrophosphorylase family protein
MQAVILAGGKGTRLKPYTTILPKPLMPVNDVPILEVVIRQLKNAGFERITMAVGYLAELIEAFFGDGRKWGVKITYSREDKPLGTAGPIGLIRDLEDNFLVMNGDVLTNLKYAELLKYHIKKDAVVTIATYNKQVKIDLGIIKSNGDGSIRDYIEKPTLDYHVSMGVYAFNKKVLDYIPTDQSFDFPDLIKKLIGKQNVFTYYFTEYWRDIGRREDYELAIEEFQKLNLEI